MSSTSKVKVAVRLKPEARMGRRCTFLSGKDSIMVGDKSFHYDHVYDETCNQQEIYDSCVFPLVTGCFKGFNATVFAYGQTGSGKTHSIVGLPRVPEDEGIIPRAIRHIFDYLRADRTGRVVSIHISFLEIYNDECRDLLHPDIQSRDIMIREDKDGRIFFTGAREEVVGSVEDTLYYLERGNLSRTTAETYMNAASSRSHAIFSISIELFEYAAPKQTGTDASTTDIELETSTENTYIQSKLHLVDLAGSERAKRTGAEGVRLKESVGINQGLLALGKVIRALTAGNKGGAQAHVPYRESKLTRFLQDSLGGNSRTIMLACVSPSEINMHETLSTLQYASRARAVQNKVIANISVGVHSIPEVDSSLVGALRTQLQAMQIELDRYRSVPAFPGAALQGVSSTALVRQSLKSSDLRRSRELIHSPVSPRRAAAATAAAQDVLRVIAETHSALQEAWDELGNAVNSPQSCGIAWRAVCACGEGAAALSDALESVRSVSAVEAQLPKTILGTMDTRPGNSSAVSNQAEEIRSLRMELDECREDLKRDEDIFAEKVRELKKARKEIRELQLEGQDMAAKLRETQQTTEQQKRLLDAQKPRDRSADGSDLHLSSAAQSKSPSVNMGRYTDHDPEEGDLELSIAVAVTEPDISQLMEDLENISREKEKVLGEKNIAESKCINATSEAEQQREEFKRGQEELRRRLRDLEINIKLKQELIADLTKGQNEATQLAERHEARVLLLEQEQNQLQAQLGILNKARRQTFEEAEEERSRRKELEGRLREAQEQLGLMELQRKKQEKKWRAEREAEEKRRMEAKRTEEHLNELTTLQSSYAKLTAQVEHNESQHRKDLDSLTAQVAQFKRSSSDAKQTIQTLEAKNSDLLARLERSAKSRERAISAPRPRTTSSPSVQPPFPAQGSTVSAGSTRMRGVGASPQRSTRPSTRSNDDSSVATHGSEHSRFTIASNSSAVSGNGSVRGRGKQFSCEWLLQRVDDFTAAQFAKTEVTRLKTSCRAADKERSELQAELGSLQNQQKDAEGILLKQLHDVEGRIEKLVHATQSLKASQNGTNAGNDKLVAAEKTLRATLEHRAELSQRLNHGALGEDALSRMQDIREELETLDTEISLNEVRLAEEMRRIGRVHGSKAAGGRGKEEVAAINTMLYCEMEDLITGTIGRSFSEQDRVMVTALAQLAQTLVETKCRAGADNSAVQSLRAVLEEKQGECEELINSMQRTRGDAHRRQEQLRVESEDKIAFLLAQLRSAEAKLVDSSMRQSQQTPLDRGTHADSSLQRNDGLVRSTAASRDAGLRGSGGSVSIGWRQSDAELSSYLEKQGSVRGSDGREGVGEGDAQNVNLEVARRWQSEKERRELLERRNGELLRELRALKSRG